MADIYESDGINWLLVIPEYTELNLASLLKVIERYDSSQPHFIGRALQDKQRVITHHYADPALKYPDTSSGMLLSWPMVVYAPSNLSPSDFNIDPRHEVSLLEALHWQSSVI